MVKLRASHTPPRKRGAAPSKKPKKTKPVLPPRAAREPGPAPAPIRKARLDTIPAESVASEGSRKLAIEIAAAAIEKKAVGLEVLDVAGRVDYADFLVLMSGRSDRQVSALADGIEEALRTKGRRPLNVEGKPTGRWVLMDYGDVIVHVFLEDVRPSYDLEGLWEDARRVPLKLGEPSSFER
jgi:ribosome-associated protein